ncbi:RICIN domain-containing protein [Pilimelia columellifera]|uniref:Ricin B lectin domain-containing protein n=1 Tax=Pilimelia columellifera subsp. columellifera TaxID=706583 RepID=A0ABN3N7E2_9ACTN
MRLTTRLAITVAAVGAGMALTAAPSSAAPGSGTGVERATAAYELRARHSGRCLDVFGASAANGADAIQWTCHQGANQHWRMVPAGGGWHEIRALHSNKCLDVLAASTTNGADVVQWACHGGANQRWLLVSTATGMEIRARHSGKCLDVFGASMANGADVIQWTCNGGANQRWQRV